MHSEVYGVHDPSGVPERGRPGRCLMEGRQLVPRATAVRTIVVINSTVIGINKLINNK